MMFDAQFIRSDLVDLVWKLNSQAALLAVLVGIVCFVGRQRLTPNWRAFLWMLVFLRLVMPSGPSSMFSLGHLVNPSVAPRTTMTEISDSPQIHLAPQITASGRSVESNAQVVADGDSAPFRATGTPTIEVNRWSKRDACIAVSLSIAVVLLGRLALLKLQLARELGRLEQVEHAEIIQLARSTAIEANLSKVPRMLWGASEASPAVCGWLFPVLILPKNSPLLAPARLRAVLLHEFRHIRTGDTLLTWPLRILCAAYWFNPLLWYASHKWHEERELCCDEWVLQRIGLEHRRSYLETLVDVVTRSSQSAPLQLTVNIVSTHTVLERRIVAMKRYRPSTWTGWIAGSLLSLLVAVVGLTDVARATNEPATGSASKQLAPAAGDDTAVSQEANPQPTNADAAKPTLKPKIIFAKHVILWEGTEVLTEDQLKERLATLRATQPVKPLVYHSQGFSLKGYDKTSSEADTNRLLNDRLGRSLELVGRDQWSFMSFLTRRGSGAVDQIQKQSDLKIDSARSLKGQVVTPHANGTREPNTALSRASTTPAKGAQVVILPLGEPCDIILRDGKLRDPQDEVSYETNAEGMFEADPSSLAFDPVHLYGDGKYLTLILHETGYRMINGQLAASDAIYELLPWTNVTIDTRHLKENEQIEIWMTPEGAPAKLPGLLIGWVGRSQQPATVKLPRGKGSAVYQRKTDDQWHDTHVRHPLEITTTSPSEIALPAIP